MAPSAAVSGFGTLFKIGDGGGTEVFTTIAEVLDISGPNLSVGTADATNMNSPGAWAEKIATIKDGGTITFDLNWLPADTTQSYAAGLLHDMTNGTKRNFRVVWPNAGATTWTLPAIVTGFAPKAPVNGKLTTSVTLTVSGQPTLA